jgi:hypothetical protein
VFGPSKEFHLKKGKHNLLEPCDPSAEALEDILVTLGMSGKDAAHIGLKHGAAVVQSMLAKETANKLRDTILTMNSIASGFPDMASPKHRHNSHHEAAFQTWPVQNIVVVSSPATRFLL